MARKRKSRESQKISKLVHEEGVEPRQAIAMSLSMKRAGRLGPRGRYIRAKQRRRGGRE